MKLRNMTNVLRGLLGKPYFMWIGVGAGLIAYVLLALQTITRSSFWFDEAFSAYIVRFNYWDIARYTAADVHPPLYYWALKTWQYAFGPGEFGLRSMSVLFAAVALLLGFLLVRRWFGRRAAFTSLALLVVSPMLVRYGQEARMYTMVAAITIGATYVLTLAVETRRKRLWLLYGVLVAAGMLTHYFTALVWIAHWLWRAAMTYEPGVGKKAWLKKITGERWLWAYLVAIGCFALWLPFMAIQLVSIQVSGFWIGPVGADTFTNYLTNYLFYLEHGETHGWWAFALVVLVVSGSYLAVKAYQGMDRKRRRLYALLVGMAIVPVVGLFVVSLPPAKSSFVERYLLPSYVAVSLVLGIAVARAPLRRALRLAFFAALITLMVTGISNVYWYGNYNKSTQTDIETRQLTQKAMEAATPGEPIIAASPWLFYEAVPYATPEHQVYYLEKTTDWKYGSLKMLRDNPQYKISDISEFAKRHPKAWYIGSQDAPYTSWKKLRELSFTSRIRPSQSYQAVEFRLR